MPDSFQPDTPAADSFHPDKNATQPEGFWHSLYSSSLGPIAQTFRHPIDTAVAGFKNLFDTDKLDAVADQIKQGNYGKAAGLAAMWASEDPAQRIARPIANKMVTQATTGDLLGAGGTLLGTAATLAAPEALRMLPKSIPLTPRLANPNPAEASAMEFLAEKGVPVPAGPATGSEFVRGAQKLSDTSPLGALVAQNAQRATTSALRRTAAGLVAEATPDITAESHYADFRAREADPANLRPVATGGSAAPPPELDSLAKTLAGKSYSQLAPADQARVTATAAKLGISTAAAPETIDMPMPVNVGALKSSLQPIYDEMQWMPAADRNASAGYQAVKKILEGPDNIPASQAEIGLGGIKKMAREDVGRNAGLAKFIAPKLQELIDTSVRSIGGEDAVQSLQQGRIAAASEAGARWLTDTFQKAEAEGGFNREQGIWADWQRLPDAAKKTMFTDKQVFDLDRFFLGVKKLAQNPNPSGTAVLGNIGTQAGLLFTHPQIGAPIILGTGALSKLLHSQAGVKLLTEGLSVGPATARGATVANEIAAIAAEKEEEQSK